MLAVQFRNDRHRSKPQDSLLIRKFVSAESRAVNVKKLTVKFSKKQQNLGLTREEASLPLKFMTVFVTMSRQKLESQLEVRWVMCELFVQPESDRMKNLET